MASSPCQHFVIIECREPHLTEPELTHEHVFLSAAEISNWDVSSILPHHHIVKIQADRNRLIEHSSYFRGFLSGSFRESQKDYVIVQWNREAFIDILKFIYSCPLDVTSKSFPSLFEAALFFGVEALLLKCKTWFAEKTSLRAISSPPIYLDDLIEIWNFALEHGIDFISEPCTSYLARNFMWAKSLRSFSYVPYNLLLSCVKHLHLTVDSEKDLADGILFWLTTDKESSKGFGRLENNCTDILKQIRVGLLPLWFVAGKKRCCYFSELANESIVSILNLIEHPDHGSVDSLGEGYLPRTRIRLTEFTEKLDLSGCPQITFAVLLLSMLPYSYDLDPKIKNRIKRSLSNLTTDIPISKGLLPTSSFEAVCEVDISNCPSLNLEAAIECFSKSFPSLRIVKAAHCWNFKTKALSQLVHKCPLVLEVDITVDISPVIPAQVSIMTSSSLISPQLLLENEFTVLEDCLAGRLPSPSSITKLTLEGRTDFSDLDLRRISEFCASLDYVNLRGCTSLTDLCISNFISRCRKLHSVVVCDTSFGKLSIQALCSDNTTIQPPHFRDENWNLLALKLQMLHMGGCKDVDEASLLELLSQAHILKSLCLRDTHLTDDALYSFSGSCLKMLDISNTMVSANVLAHVVHGNPGLKQLKARGCKNLFHQCKSPEFGVSSSSKDFYLELGKKCQLEEIALGWGFSLFSFRTLNHAITSLRAITVGLGGTLGQDALTLLPATCPLLESVILHFQVISDSILINIFESLRHLEEFALCYCLGDLSPLSFKYSVPSLRKLRLERVTPWMTNADLVTLTENCGNLVELSLLGCTLLNSDSQAIISRGWPGLVSLHLEDCGDLTAKGVASLCDCIALEDLLLRHNGCGIQKNFILDAASKLPMLRKVSVDFCDATEGDFNLPDHMNRHALSIVKIARCKLQRRSLDVKGLEIHKVPVHKQTLVVTRKNKHFIKTLVKQRV